MLILNAVVQTQMMLNAQVAQIRDSCPGKNQKTSQFAVANRKLKLHEIAEKLKISEGNEFTILHEHLSMRKLCSK